MLQYDPPSSNPELERRLGPQRVEGVDEAAEEVPLEELETYNDVLEASLEVTISIELDGSSLEVVDEVEASV